MSRFPNPAFPLKANRVHEVCGPAATAFAGVCCAQGTGPLLWITESWRGKGLNPLGLTAFADPRRLLMVRAKDQTDTLASTEEALRAGAVDLVVIELSKPLSLTAGRRLQLAAEAGRTRGLCLIPEGMGSNATETRWQAMPLFDPEEGADSTLMRWSLTKNKSGTFGAWDVRWNHAARRLDVVSPAGQRPEPPGAAG